LVLENCLRVSILNNKWINYGYGKEGRMK